MFDLNDILAQTRTACGKGNMRRMRRKEDRFPAVIYGAGQDNSLISLDQKSIMHTIENEAFFSSILTLKVDGKAEKVVIKAVQRHPYKPHILHMDFLRISAKEKLTMNVPLHFIGEEEAPGVKDESGVISHTFTELEIKCLPADLPEFIKVDISKLALHEAVHLLDVKLPKGVELATPIEDEEHNHPVVSIHPPKVEVEIEEEAEAEGEGEAEAQPEETKGEAETKPEGGAGSEEKG